MFSRPYCRRCGCEIPNLVDTGSNIYLCADCQSKAPRRDGLIDFTELRGRVIKPKKFVDEATGEELEDNPPLNKVDFFRKHAPNLWAEVGMKDERKNHV
jgi:hypothetical protein